MKTSSDVRVFLEQGFRRKEYFSHEVVCLEKQYPDSCLLLRRRGVPKEDILSERFFQVNLYSSDVAGLPDELFRDRTVNWHNQQFGRSGLIAAAGLYLTDHQVTVTVMQSDICQQLFRHPELKALCKTQVGARFGYWYKLLFNAVLDFALERELATVYLPTARQVLSGITKPVGSELFERIYDFVGERYNSRRIQCGTAEYWEVPLSTNLDKLIKLDSSVTGAEEWPEGTIICLFHDVEGAVDTQVSEEACLRHLTSILEAEKACNVRATFNVLGMAWAEKVSKITTYPQHSLAFHSFNHRLEDLGQLPQCRKIDQQIKGYRPPRSQLTRELTDYELSYYNFEWLLSSVQSLGRSKFWLENGLVKIPVHLDDYHLFTGEMSYQSWEDHLMDQANRQDFVAIGLHDCYAACWIDRFNDLLEKLGRMGEFWTCDEIAGRVYLESDRSKSV